MSAAKAYTSRSLFTGEQWLEDHAVIVVDEIITGLLPVSAIDSQLELIDHGNKIIAPAFTDLQIYGAEAKLFAAYRNPDALLSLKNYSNAGGAAFCMPTVATNDQEVLYDCIDAIRLYWQQGGQGILGLHVEGPWINPEKRGAHVESLIHSPDLKEVEALLDHGKGVIKIITLAPEVCSAAILDRILSTGIRVFAGHSNATYEQATFSFNNGITAVTHLYNAMSPLMHRSPGLVGATLDHPAVLASIIPDGYHVDYAAIRIAKKILQQRLFAITDAVTTTTEGYYQHQPDGDRYVANGILSGSALTMYRALQNLVQKAGIETGEAIRMCSLYPAQAIRLDDQPGKIAPGYLAKLVALPGDLGDTAPQLIS